MKKTVLFLLLILSQLTYSQITVSTSGNDIALNSSLLGLNGRSTEGPSWSNSTFLGMVSEMNPAYVRYPAGTIGNQWNWKTGTFIPGYGNSTYTFTIPMLINGLPSGAKIIYMINMVLPTAQTGITFSTTTDAVLSTDATLAAKITDILNAFAEFEKNGHLPEVAEIGNELYFSNTEAGVYAANPTLYMSHAKQIVQAIKNKYPAVKILLCTTKGGTTSRDNWNNIVFNTLNSDTQFKTLIYGVVQHHYINATYGYTADMTDITSSETLMREGIQYVLESQTDYDLVPNSLKLWITEFGVTKNTADATWTSGLRTANMALSFMQLGIKTDNLTWHHITDDPNVLNTTYMKLGPSGLAFSLLSQAMNNKTTYSKLVFSNMLTTDKYAQLYGYKFGNADTESILIVNWGSSTYSNLNLSGLFQGNTISFAKQYWTSSPILSPVYSGSNISTLKASNLSAYTIKPYSISCLSVDIPGTGLKQLTSHPDIRISQAGVNQELCIQSLCVPITELTIYNLSGQIMLQQKLNNQTGYVSVNHFPKGMYLIRVQSNKFDYTSKTLINN